MGWLVSNMGGYAKGEQSYHLSIIAHYRQREERTMKANLYRYLGGAMLLLGILVSADGFGVIWGA